MPRMRRKEEVLRDYSASDGLATLELGEDHFMPPTVTSANLSTPRRAVNR